MSSTAKQGVRMKREEVHTSNFQIDVHDITATSGTNITFNLPPGGYNILISVWATALDQPVIAKLYPFIDHEQTLTNGANKFLSTGETTAVTLITVEANTATAKGYQYAVIQSGDQYGLAAPVLSHHGAQLVISTTATTGLINFASVSVEI
jgi:hypothetical protein